MKEGIESFCEIQTLMIEYLMNLVLTGTINIS